MGLTKPRPTIESTSISNPLCFQLLWNQRGSSPMPSEYAKFCTFWQFAFSLNIKAELNVKSLPLFSRRKPMDQACWWRGKAEAPVFRARSILTSNARSTRPIAKKKMPPL